MARSVLEQYTISDFLSWHRQHLLVLNASFQRREVWTPAARSYLIDTILRQMPVPKIYLRTRIDSNTQQAIREVVDGQQRLRAIVDFVDKPFPLTGRAGDLKGLTYETLDEEQKQQFLAYPLSVDQLINASDDDVLEVFARLNSYTVTLNAQEKRHAKYPGDFKWAVHESARKWEVLWTRYHVLSVARRVRMLDDQLVAEMYLTLLDGLSAGDQASLTRLYSRMGSNFNDEVEIVAQLDKVLARLTSELGEAIGGSLASPNHFLMLFAATAHAVVGLKPGILGGQLPKRRPDALSKPTVAVDNLKRLASVIRLKGPPANEATQAFWLASKSSTQRATSRSARFPYYYAALLPEPLELQLE